VEAERARGGERIKMIVSQHSFFFFIANINIEADGFDYKTAIVLVPMGAFWPNGLAQLLNIIIH